MVYLWGLPKQGFESLTNDGVCHACDCQLVAIEKLVNQKSYKGATLAGVNGIQAFQSPLHHRGLKYKSKGTTCSILQT